MTSAEFDAWVAEQTRFEPFDMAAHEAAIAALMEEWGDIEPFNALLDRAVGKPRQEIEHAGSEKEPLTVIVREFVKPPGY